MGEDGWGRWEDGCGDGDERSNLSEVGGMDRGDVGRWEDRWGDGDECNSSGEVGDMGRGDAV